jgi:dihydroflavonol-4-reductase
VTFGEFFDAVGRVTGVKTPTTPIPSGLARTIARGMELWADNVSHQEPRATLKAIQYMQRRAFFDVSKARRDLGLPSRPLEESIERAIRWFKDHGKLR